MSKNYKYFQKISLQLLSIVGLLSVVSLGFASGGSGPVVYPAVNYNSGAASPEIIKQGEYLAKVGDCMACHTDAANGGKPFAGGLPVVTPFGTMYTMNITPDKEYGVGNWTDEDFIDALRHGVAPNGDNYFPAFPYPYFNKLSDDEVKSIAAYLRSIPAVNTPNKPLEMPWPFSWRILQYGWKLLFFYPYMGQFEPDPSKSDIVNRGDFLVEGLGHCSLCHSPLNLLGSPKRKYLLAGGFVEGFFAPNITSFGLKDASVQDVVDVFAKGELLNNRGPVAGPMADVNRNSLQFLTTDDLTAIATYLKQVPAREIKQKSVSSGADAGKNIYNDYCAACHASGAGGAPQVGNGAAWKPIIALGIDNVYKNAINGIASMPAKGTCTACTDEQIQQTVDYMVSMSQGANATVATKRPATQAPNPPAGTGKKVYEESCSVCHADGKMGAPVVGDSAAWELLVKKNMDILFEHAINGYHSEGKKFYMPAKGGCFDCSNADVEAAVKYMVDQSISEGNYSLW